MGGSLSVNISDIYVITVITISDIYMIEMEGDIVKTTKPKFYQHFVDFNICIYVIYLNLIERVFNTT